MWLLNLEQDPHETKDWARDHPEKRKELIAKLETYQQRQLYYYMTLPETKRTACYPPQH